MGLVFIKSFFSFLKNYFFLSFLIFGIYLFTLQSCKSPVGQDDNTPGRRDYVWTVDTIASSTFLQRCWGNSPSDVWAVDPGGGLDKTIYHYDGEKWSTDGVSRNISPSAVYGFGSNDVWIGGMNGKLWHYDGKLWKQFSQDTVQGYSWNLIFENIYGTSPDNIYAIGTAYKSWDSYVRKGVIFHFDGSKWNNISIPEFKNVDFFDIKRSDISCKYYLIGLRNEPSYGDTNKVYEFDGKDIIEIYSAPDGSSTAATTLYIGKEVYIEFHGIIHSYQDGKFLEILNLNQKTNYVYAMYGRNMNDIFLYMLDGVAHYNGTDIEYILKPLGPRLPIPASIFFEKDIFFIAYDYYGTGANIIFRGTLK